MDSLAACEIAQIEEKNFSESLRKCFTQELRRYGREEQLLETLTSTLE